MFRAKTATGVLLCVLAGVAHGQAQLGTPSVVEAPVPWPQPPLQSAQVAPAPATPPAPQAAAQGDSDKSEATLEKLSKTVEAAGEGSFRLAPTPPAPTIPYSGSLPDLIWRMPIPAWAFPPVKGSLPGFV